MFRSGAVPEIIRSHQKDELYLTYLRSTCADLAQTLFGSRFWIRWRKQLDILADLGYFTLTTFAGYQTLGEEYVSILQVDSTLRNLPSKVTRALMILLHVCSPYIIQKILDWFEHQLKSHRFHISAETREILLQWLPSIKLAVTIIHRCHLAAFYLQGIFYQMAKRIFGIQYLRYNMKSSTMSEGPSFKLLGWLSVIQLSATLMFQMYKGLKSKANTPTVDASSRSAIESDEPEWLATPERKCALCLAVRKHSTATPCGHLFCWQCIHDWCQSKSECPLCREQFQASRLISLQNYDPT